MKILKPGREQGPNSKEIECSGAGNGGGGCGALLLIDSTDVFQTHSSCMGESSLHRTIQCPQCSSWTDLGQGVAMQAKSQARVCYKCKSITCIHAKVDLGFDKWQEERQTEDGYEMSPHEHLETAWVDSRRYFVEEASKNVEELEKLLAAEMSLVCEGPGISGIVVRWLKERARG